MEILNLQKTIVFHLNKIGSLIIFILLPDELSQDPKKMKFLHKCETNKIEIKIKGINGNLLINYIYDFNDNSLRIINIKNTIPKVLSISSEQNINNRIKYLTINYSITKSTINDYFFSDKILNFDTYYDYLQKIIEKKINQNDFKKLKLIEIICRNCGEKLIIEPKEIIYDYDSQRIGQNLEEFFTCQTNYNSFMKNEEATKGIENLKKAYEIKYNMDNIYLWIFNKYIDFSDKNCGMEVDESKDKENEEFIFCQKCKEIIGKKAEHDSILFNKLFLNLINFKLLVDDNKENIIDINNFFSIDYLNILLSYSINKGNKFLKFINRSKKEEIIFETKINIVGLINNNYNSININEIDNKTKNFVIDNYINMFEVKIRKIENSINNEDLVEIIYLNEKDFSDLENILEENMKLYKVELFFYKLLVNESKKFYCFSYPKKI